MHEGNTLNQYRIMSRIGKGGMGTVYLAEDTRLQRRVALKFISNATPDAVEEIARFHREALAAARLNHPNICTVYELGEAGDRTYIAMEYVEGMTLKEQLLQGRIEETQLRNWLHQMADGLQTAHEAGIIHRDIKPANIMITDKGRVKIMDFGIAKLAEYDTELTKAHSRMGTITYMSPEQARGEPVDQQTDIWSTGVVLYELATGKKPFAGAFREAIMYAMLHDDPPSPSSLNPEISPDLERIINRCLEKDRQRRFPTVAALLADLHLPDEKSKSPLPSNGFLAPALRKYWPRPLLTMSALIAVLLIFFIIRGTIDEQGQFGELPNSKSLVVLPATQPSLSETDARFRDGLINTITGSLGRIGKDEIFLYATPIEEVTSTMDVLQATEASLVLLVNVFRDGAVARIGLSLLEIESGKTIRSATVERSTSEVIALPSAVVEEVGKLLDISVPASYIETSRTTVPGAYEFYLQGLGYLQRFADGENLNASIQLFERALGADSTYALGYAGLCAAYLRLPLFRQLPWILVTGRDIMIWVTSTIIRADMQKPFSNSIMSSTLHHSISKDIEIKGEASSIWIGRRKPSTILSRRSRLNRTSIPSWEILPQCTITTGGTWMPLRLTKKR